MKTARLCLNDEQIIVNAGSDRERELLASGWKPENPENKETGEQNRKRRKPEQDAGAENTETLEKPVEQH